VPVYIINIFFSIIFLFNTNCFAIVSSAPTTELPDVGTKRARDDSSFTGSENMAPCPDTRKRLRTPASESLLATASAVSSSSPGSNTRSLFKGFEPEDMLEEDLD